MDEAIDYAAIVAQLQRENELLRLRLYSSGKIDPIDWDAIGSFINDNFVVLSLIALYLFIFVFFIFLVTSIGG